MRPLVLLCVLAVAACGEASRPAAQNLPVFSFKGVSQDAPLASVREQFAKCSAMEAYVDAVSCELKDETFAGAYLTYQSTVFDKTGFNYLYYSIASAQFENVLAKLTEAYGEPCERATSELENRMGAKFEQIEVNWCFKGGKLALQRYDENVDEGLITYWSDRGSPAEKPEPAVTPDKL